MKQVVLDPQSGRVSLVETPAPAPARNRLLVRSDVSALSPGTERQLIELSSRSLMGKARSRPQETRQALDTVRREGVRSALWKAQARMAHPFPLGYSLAGTVVELGSGLDEPAPGTRVACGGATIATHSEIVSVPPLLAVPVPEGVDQEEAAFASIGAIALHSVRLAEVGPGGTAAVMGLGLLGQLVAQIFAATGCFTVAVDPNDLRTELAQRLTGCVVSDRGESAVEACRPRGGADAVVVAVGGGGPDVFDQAVEMARDRGRIVVLGAIPLVLDRDRMYRKELSLVVARSAGAGRYDPMYEQEGVDLPIGHVRWTEGRNMAAFLELVLQRKLAIRPLITHRVPVDEARRAYELLAKDTEPYLGIVLEFGTGTAPARREITLNGRGRRHPRGAAQPGIGVIGAGTFGRGVLLPRLRKLPVQLAAIATATGASATGTARRFGFRRISTDAASVVEGDDVEAVLIATRHDLHASLTAHALAAGKGVYVEKPLAMTRDELLEVYRAWDASGAILAVGFNRRFAPLVRRLKDHLAAPGPISASYVVNVGPMAQDHWMLHPEQGGGVVLAESGHFIDTLAYLSGSLPESVSAVHTGQHSYQATIRFTDGSAASLIYNSQGAPHGPKELLTVTGRGALAELNDFRSLSIWTGARKRSVRRRRQDKGHAAALGVWVRALTRGEQPVPMLEILAVAEATLALDDALQTGRTCPVDLRPYGLEVERATDER